MQQAELSEFFTEGKVSFPVTKAFAFSLKSIRIRLARMVIVLLGVASAIAFMTMLFSMAAFTREDGGEAAGAAAGSGGAQAEVTAAAASISDPAMVIEKLGEETINTQAVARAFRPWWLVIALCISIAGITNAILMSVTERIKEIGTLKCLGAMSYHIVEIFLFESVLIGFLGGLFGSAVGTGLALMNLWLSGAGGGAMEMPTVLEMISTFGVGVLFSVLISLAAAVVPVVVAARIQPADAMRYEV